MASDFVLQVTPDNFDTEILKGDLPALVDFTATWCVPCKAMSPLVDQLAEEYKGRLRVAKVDVDTASQVAMNYGIRSVPTLLLFKGGAVVGQHVGKISREKLKEFVGKAL